MNATKMDARKIFKMIKPQLELLDHSEKTTLSKLITSRKPEKISTLHRKVRPISNAKEFLKSYCKREMERERQLMNRS